MSNKPPVDLSAMNRAFFEPLDPTARVELLCRLHTMTVELSERLARNSANPSRPPSSDRRYENSGCRYENPYRHGNR
jgi:hypothetical protein